MKSPWQVQRRLVERNDAERRWDYAFEFLVCWVQEQAVRDEACSQPSEENQDEDCPIRTGIEGSPATPSND